MRLGVNDIEARWQFKKSWPCSLPCGQQPTLPCAKKGYKKNDCAPLILKVPRQEMIRLKIWQTDDFQGTNAGTSNRNQWCSKIRHRFYGVFLVMCSFFSFSMVNFWSTTFTWIELSHLSSCLYSTLFLQSIFCLNKFIQHFNCWHEVCRCDELRHEARILQKEEPSSLEIYLEAYFGKLQRKLEWQGGPPNNKLPIIFNIRLTLGIFP